MKRLLITGAAGGVGREMRTRLAGRADILRLSDISDLGAAGPSEELVQCDLADAQAVMRLVEGCDGILHLGGVSVEDTFQKILRANIEGMYNLYEAARAHGQPRIIFASSNHTVGFHPQDRYLQADCTLKPDGLYGVSKCFGEALASLYHSKFGQETAIIRIGSCFEKPLNHRMLATWFSREDFVALIDAVFQAPRLGCPVIWGVSDNSRIWWDNSSVRYLGWQPKDTSEIWRTEIDAACNRPGPDDPQSVWQGGVFTQDPIHT